MGSTVQSFCSTIGVCIAMLHVLVCGTSLIADDAIPVSDPDGIRYFETHVRPLLAERCYKCHGSKKQESSLRLDSFVGLMKGGDAGESIVPGKPTQSLLITALKYQDPNLQMPPNGKLTDRDIAKLSRWIEIGAPHPDATVGPVDSKKRIDLKHARQFWAFRPLRQTVVPGVNSDWPASAVDRFILAKLQARGLTPAPPADRRTLLRRTTMTLTGLPPTPDELDAFAADESPAALAEVVDRLLASPHYGERWGRHWLDVVRYADSNGLDENIHHGTAWRYRDFVIEAFNSDLPFDEFVTEQIAGDLLTSATETERHRRLIATGFLAIGPKVLAEVDETKMEMDIIDEQLDTLGRSMMGLTLGCARCHDHKFDPISAKDYYALAGIFKSTRTMEHYTKIARWWENPIPSAADKSRQADHAKQIAASKSKLATFITAANRKVLDSLPDGAEPPQNLESKYPAATKAELKTLRDAITKLEKNPPEVSTAIGVGERTATDLPVHIRGSHLTLGDVVPRRFPIFLAGDQQTEFGPKQSGRLPLANWLTSEEHPLTSRVIVNRVWRWHFGRGLVDSPDNFGNLGQRPVNQPLLDWLAVEFRRHGWSIKWLHRTILLSSTWRMSSRMDAKASEVDPENRLQWRADIRRLEAEAIRDSILAVTGQLDRTMRGTLITLKNRSFFFDHTSKDTTDYSSNRRSVYLPVVRNHLYEVFSLFDYSDAGSVVGSRTTSVVAPQALFMMNSDFMLQASRSLAKLGTVDGSDDARVNGLYRRVLGRRPTDRELKQSLDFINRSAALGSERDAGWAYLGQVLLSSNEFIYLR